MDGGTSMRMRQRIDWMEAEIGDQRSEIEDQGSEISDQRSVELPGGRITDF